MWRNGKEGNQREKRRICLVEEREGEGEEELILPVWEEDIGEQSGRRQFSVPRKKKKKEGEKKRAEKREYCTNMIECAGCWRTSLFEGRWVAI